MFIREWCGRVSLLNVTVLVGIVAILVFVKQTTYNNTVNMDNVQPILFVSHGGGPSFFLDAKRSPMFRGLDKDSAAADILRNLVKTLKLQKPRAILVISAHWESKTATVNTNTKHTLLYDYYNFPPDTYKITWPVEGCPDVARKAAELLVARGITCKEDGRRGLDHGVFCPLKLVYPEAGVPVCQISLLENLDVRQHLEIGEALGDLCRQGVLIIGSGFATHNLMDINPGQPTPSWAFEFQAWLHDTLLNEQYTSDERKERLLQCEKSAPHFYKAHPRIEHFLPLIMSSAASGYRPGKLVHSEFVLQIALNEHYLFSVR